MRVVTLVDSNCEFGFFEKEAIRLNRDSCFRNITPEESLKYKFDTIIISDMHLDLIDKINADTKILWLMEPPVISEHIYHYAVNYQDQYSFAFTYIKDFVNQFPEKFIYYPWGTSMINFEDHAIHNKTKNVSMIVSDKRFASGHKLRHEIIDGWEHKMDGIKRCETYADIEYKFKWLKDYRYSFAIENSSIDGYFSEKLIDCFMTGTIPIYWGDRGVVDIFNSEGIIMFNDLDDVENVLEKATKDFYDSKLDIIKENYDTAKKYLYPWDYIFDTGAI